ncbi:MAG: hypothetical protein HRU13_06315 [Phycisphaerales bacterium]|nr:hypothetical protein [Phycisphaerales bacterium]
MTSATRTTTLAAAAIVCTASAAHAQAWDRFIFDGAGSITTIDVVVSDDFPQLQITDAFLSGDQFSVRVLDGGSVVEAFDCSVPTIEGDQIGDDYDAAFADDRWSSGEVFISARGPLTIEITATASPFGGGGAGWRLTEGEAPCRADLDGDGSLTLFDFLAFQNLFDAGDLSADFDGDGRLTLFDFLEYQNEFDAGCD